VTERGEICLVIGATRRAAREEPSQEALDAVRELVSRGLPARRASELVAGLTGAPRRLLYDAAVKGSEAPPPPTLP
jgi:16S rRNA C1402 (ribose-2'-O) methylase RsmI